MKEILDMLKAAFTTSVPLSVVAEAFEVVADLRDGDAHLSETNRARIGLAIEQAKNPEVR